MTKGYPFMAVSSTWAKKIAPFTFKWPMVLVNNNKNEIGYPLWCFILTLGHHGHYYSFYFTHGFQSYKNSKGLPPCGCIFPSASQNHHFPFYLHNLLKLLLQCYPTIKLLMITLTRQCFEVNNCSQNVAMKNQVISTTL